jgi:hypothetical protein
MEHQISSPRLSDSQSRLPISDWLGPAPWRLHSGRVGPHYNRTLHHVFANLARLLYRDSWRRFRAKRAQQLLLAWG